MRKKSTQVDEKRTGDHIAYYIKETNMSISDFARQLGVTDNAVRNYINGFNLPATETMYKMCILLGVDIKDIIVEKGDGDQDEEV